ncbi:MAG: hypothetical protein V1930_08110, partial [Pseudomonadota bacterium]
MIFHKKIAFLSGLFLAVTLHIGPAFAWEKAGEETYSIFLTKTAEAEKRQEMVVVGDKKVLTQ